MLRAPSRAAPSSIWVGWLAYMTHAGTDHAGDPQTRARPEFAQNASKHDLAAIGEVFIGDSYYAGYFNLSLEARA